MGTGVTPKYRLSKVTEPLPSTFNWPTVARFTPSKAESGISTLTHWFDTSDDERSYATSTGVAPGLIKNRFNAVASSV